MSGAFHLMASQDTKQLAHCTLEDGWYGKIEWYVTNTVSLFTYYRHSSIAR